MKFRFWALVEPTMGETREQPGGIFRVATDGSSIERLVGAGEWRSQPELASYVMEGDSGAWPLETALAEKLISEYPWKGARVEQQPVQASASGVLDGVGSWTVERRPGARFAVTNGVLDDSAHWGTAFAAGQRAVQLNRERAAQLAAGIAAGIASVDPAAELADGDGQVFYAVLCIDEWETNDNRYFEKFTWDTLPLPFLSLTENQGGGHWGAEIAGTIRTIERLSDGRRIFATGVLDTTEVGTETAQQIGSQSLRYVSVDPADYEYEEEITKMGSDGWPLEGRLRFTQYQIGGATACPFPAIRLAVCWLDGMDSPGELSEALPAPVERVLVPEIVDMGDNDSVIVIMASAAAAGDPEPMEQAVLLADEPEHRAILASAHAQHCELTSDCGGPALPPSEWFTDPGFTEATAGRVDMDGRVSGHLALWDVPHRGFLHYSWSDKVYAPRSSTGYAQFLTKRTQVACCADASCGHERETIRTGTLVLGTTHAGKRLTAAQAAAFYENTGMAAADIVVGEDAFGIWYSGALRPGTDDSRVREFLGAAPSGDWRWVAGDLELMATLMVNTEGFANVAASAFVEDGEVRSLFMGWAPPSEDVDEALVASIGVSLAKRTPPRTGQPVLQQGLVVVERARLEALERDMDALRPLAADRIAEGIEQLVT